MFFRRRQPRLTPQQSLAARPVRLVDANVTSTDAGGGGKLRVPLRPSRWAGWLFRLPPGASKTFELDPLGLLVWNACDGKTSVQQIIRKLAKAYRLNLAEAQVPTLTFLQMLARKGLIGLTLPGDGRPSDRRRKGD